MKTISTVKEMHSVSHSLKRMGKKIGLVPTMGYLHEGHLSLIKKSLELCDVTVASIFVNPSQFGPSEDYEKYPRDIERDNKLLKEQNVDYLFTPSADEIYPSGYQTYVEVNEISKKFEGEFRPNHFKGVTTIVSILFNCIQPDYAFFGQKDAQQAAVIKQMVNDLKYDIDIRVCPIIREYDGLAMSSRNVYLSPEERTKALFIHKALLYARKLIEGKETSPQTVVDNMRVIFNEEKSIKLDYIGIVNAYGFREVDLLEDGNEYYILVAARVGNTRLIDNELMRLQ
ncbi:MAG: pantoate--beta-alanine ligase [Ignavibacteria bacterium RBG_16_34_14]|nr:MAG: pantoate--beta-alanine ligase [Ignavibacteria bacterium RBG_16_34_14]